MTSSSEQTTALIAELRRAADKKRADLALQSAALFTRAADALEAADRALTIDWSENITPEDQSAIRRHMHELAVRNMALAAPRVVTTVAELNALPDGSVVLYHDSGDVLERFEDEWYTTASTIPFYTGSVFQTPATVLWVGGTE